jgi:ferredoxin
MNTEIYYFSGTGNSLYISKELQKRIPASKIVPIVSLLDNNSIKTNAETIGFVFPIHYMAIPTPVKYFIKKIDLDLTKYIFAVATRLGSPHTAFSDIDKILKKKGRLLDSHFALTMANNDPKYDYKVPTSEEIKKIESVIDENLNVIQKIIIKKKISREKDNTITDPVPPIVVSIAPFLNSIFRPIGEFYGFKSHYYADNNCISCGTCEKVCLSKKIKIINKKPVWQKNVKCFYCYACINYCPKESVQIKSFTEKNGRYNHPYATADDISGQK